ncbi:DUF2383 domain-containing protein [Alkalilimnicola sp. S0819]|uniref:DUF2383 domain-containing protein n=1 Tax=Alkalilimnicola sp. S0819 TaxID=2613922 RepID=UPI00186A3F50|nr:DUF2383 domain-containing protein [Alkalilimnicola sp. S0819]
MWREDKQVALDELIVACREAADRYRYDAQLLGESAIAELFLRLAEERQGWAERLERRLRELGDMPSVPDPEWEVLQNWKERLRAGLGGSAPEALLAAREEGEKALAQALSQALQQDLAPAAREDLQRMQGLLAQGRQQLADAHASRA